MNWMIQGWRWLFGYRQVPFAVRGIFRRELPHMLLWGVVWGALNGRYCGFIAARSLHAPDALVGVVVSSIAIANLFAVWWASLAARRSVRRLLIPGILILAAIMFSFALTPMSRSLDRLAGIGSAEGATRVWSLSAALFAAQVMLAWIVVQGINTVRTRMWKLNYPASHRARIMARFAMWQVLVAVLTSALIGTYMDGRIPIRVRPWIDLDWSLAWLPHSGTADAFDLLFPAAGLVALASAWFYRRVKVRREHHALAEHSRTRQAPMPHDTEASFILPGWFQTLRGGVMIGLGEARTLLRQDLRFRRYMSWQMLAGTGTMLMEVPTILILNELFQVNYVAAAGLLAIVPQLVVIGFTPAWAKLFDRWPLMGFRITQMSVWILSRLTLGAGFWLHSLWLVGAGLALGGLALAGGRFSWQLGHMAFSQPHNDATYMGIHQALTGVRGLITPFLGAALYRYVMGWHVVWLSVALQAASIYGFARLRKMDGPRPIRTTGPAS